MALPRASFGASLGASLEGWLGALCLASSCGGAPTGNGRSLLLVTLDTTRPDALSCYGGQPTPALARLAEEGVVFERAYSSVPLTLPSHATLLSGLFPPRHGVRDNGKNPLPDGARTLAEVLRDAGYQTAAFVGAVVLDPAFGLQQGFERYDAPHASGAAHEDERLARGGERPAREVIDGALGWLRQRDPERPWFLWVHLFDAHTPYTPAELPSARTPRALYDAEVSAADRELGRLFDEMRAEGALDGTLVVAAGDHGEGFGEHGEDGHSVHCYETTLHVPLIVRAPFWERARAGTRSTELVALADVLPTACAALGLDAPPALDGRSFWADAAPEERGIYFESYYGYLNFGWSPIAGWIDGHGKYLHASDSRYFDPLADPDEERDLSGERAADVQRAQRAMVELAAAPRLAASETATTPELLESLRGLGYATIGSETLALPHPLEDTGLPSPESMRESYATTLRALELGKRGDVAGAERLFREVLAVNPRNPLVLDQLAVCQAQSGDYEGAAATLRALLDVGLSETPGTWFKLATCLQELERPDEAIDALRRALALDPKRRNYLVQLARLLRTSGRADEALDVERRLAELGGKG